MTHGGDYAGMHDFGNGPEPAVYSFGKHNGKSYGTLSPYNPDDWIIMAGMPVLFYPYRKEYFQLYI